MAVFRFRLQSVLDLRIHAEDEQKDLLAREQMTLGGLLEERKSLHAEFVRWSERYLESAGDGIRPEEAVRIYAYTEDLSRRIVEQDEAIAAQRSVVEEARELLIERTKDRKSLEKLYERQLEAFFREENLKTEKEIEEMISAKAAR